MPTRFIKQFYCPVCGYVEEIRGFVVEPEECPKCAEAEAYWKMYQESKENPHKGSELDWSQL